MHAVPECHTIRHLLDGLVDQTLTSVEHERVRSHLESCAECQEVSLAKDPALLFLVLGEQRQSEFFWAGLWRDIQEEIEETPQRSNPGWRGHLRKTFSAAAAFAAISAVGILYLNREEPTPVVSSLELALPGLVEEIEALPSFSLDLPRATAEDPDTRIVTLESSMPIVMVYNPNLDL